MKVSVNYGDNTEQIRVNTPYNTYVEVFNDMFDEYQTRPLYQLQPSRNGGDYIIKNEFVMLEAVGGCF